MSHTSSRRCWTAPEPSDRLAEGLERLSVHESRSTETATLGNVDSAEVELDANGEFMLSSRRREGAALRQARIVFRAGDQPNYLVAYLILRRIQRVGDVIGSWPPMSGIEAGACGQALVVLFSPRSADEALLAPGKGIFDCVRKRSDEAAALQLGGALLRALTE